MGRKGKGAGVWGRGTGWWREGSGREGRGGEYRHFFLYTLSTDFRSRPSVSQTASKSSGLKNFVFPEVSCIFEVQT